jgi:hypothetical protein
VALHRSKRAAVDAINPLIPKQEVLIVAKAPPLPTQLHLISRNSGKPLHKPLSAAGRWSCYDDLAALWQTQGVSALAHKDELA